MEADYTVLFRFWRYFVGRDKETGKLFLGESRKGYYRLLWVRR